MSTPLPPEPPLNLQGQLLLAAPALGDGIFHRAVLLLAEHSTSEGAFGLILNRPTGRNVGDLIADSAFDELREVAVHQGGPVAVEQLAFAALWLDHENRLHWETRISAEQATERIRRPDTLVRAFVGHSGWAPGQLEDELRRAAWIATRPPASLLGFPHDHSLWAETLRRISPYHRILAEAPADPFVN